MGSMMVVQLANQLGIMLDLQMVDSSGQSWAQQMVEMKAARLVYFLADCWGCLSVSELAAHSVSQSDVMLAVPTDANSAEYWDYQLVGTKVA
jgi:hypothetical protein